MSVLLRLMIFFFWLFCIVMFSLLYSRLLLLYTENEASLPHPRAVLEGALAGLLDGMTGMAVKSPVPASVAEMMAVRPGRARPHHTVVVGGEGVGGRIIHNDAGFSFRARRPVAAELGRVPGRVGTALEATLATDCPSLPTSEGVVLSGALFLLFAEAEVGHDADEVLYGIKLGGFRCIGREGIVQTFLVDVVQNFVLAGNERSTWHAIVVHEAKLFLTSSSGMERGS